MFAKPILITGCARSGTSITAGVIHRCGAFGGHTCGPTSVNRRGQYEHNRIRNNITKPYLSSIGADPMGQNPLPQIEGLPLPNHHHLRERVLRIMMQDGLTSGMPWYIKEAKSCLIWPVWATVFPKARWVFVRRDKRDIARSCVRTGFMKAYTNQKDWIEKWIEPHLCRLREMKEYGLNIFEVWPSKMINGDFDEIKTVVSELGLKWDEEAVCEFISPDLWHGR